VWGQRKEGKLGYLLLIFPSSRFAVKVALILNQNLISGLLAFFTHTPYQKLRNLTFLKFRSMSDTLLLFFFNAISLIDFLKSHCLIRSLILYTLEFVYFGIVFLSNLMFAYLTYFLSPLVTVTNVKYDF
jgi:hypothetical protein